MNQFWHRSNIHGRNPADQKNAPQEATAVSSDKTFYLISRVAERRQIQIERLHTAFTNALRTSLKAEAGPSANLLQ